VQSPQSIALSHLVLSRFTRDAFTVSFVTTIGVDYQEKREEIDGKAVRIVLWDTSGQERFKSMTRSYYRGVQGIVLVYDLMDRRSFEHVGYWMRQIKEHGRPNVSVCLVGNKVDMAETCRKVTMEEGQALADEYKVPFFETSARWDTNVTEMFLALGRLVLANSKPDELKRRSRRAKPERTRTSGSSACPCG
jgi:Ras-related protein Rab-8A